jgi:hypothetical protein
MLASACHMVAAFCPFNSNVALWAVHPINALQKYCYHLLILLVLGLANTVVALLLAAKTPSLPAIATATNLLLLLESELVVEGGAI